MHKIYFMWKVFFIIICIFFCENIYSQSINNNADYIRGFPNKFRTSYDVKNYDISLDFDFNSKSIKGVCKVFFKLLGDLDTLQIDLYENMTIDSIVVDNQLLDYFRYRGAVSILHAFRKSSDNLNLITIYYHGEPHVAIKPPWDGGFVWSKDKEGNPFIGVSVEGVGASLWYPCKDLLSDKPDSVKLRALLPSDLMLVSNGQLREVVLMDNNKTLYNCFVGYPIVNYNVTFYIGKYVHLKDSMQTVDNNWLSLNYYVLNYNKDKAIKHFNQTKKVINSYEHYFGEYPFLRDGFALVESPYAGMEHQSAIAYGNSYKDGYDGYDYSQIGLKEDYIILHEAAHEWWGNSLSMDDLSDMWINEALATYSECLYVELNYGHEMYNRYVNAKRSYMLNDKPSFSAKYFNQMGSFDMYYKGALMFHTIRNVLQNDSLFFNALKQILIGYKYKNISTEVFIKEFNLLTKYDFTDIFYEFLGHTERPLLSYKCVNKKQNVSCRLNWVSDNPNFVMPIEIESKGTRIRLDVKNTRNMFVIKDTEASEIKFLKENLFYFKK